MRPKYTKTFCWLFYPTSVKVAIFPRIINFWLCKGQFFMKKGKEHSPYNCYCRFFVWDFCRIFSQLNCIFGKYLMVSQNNKLTNLKSFCVRVWNLRSCHLRTDLRQRPSMQTHNRDVEKTLGQASQFNIWTIWSMDRTSGEPEFVILWHSSLCLALIQQVSAWGFYTGYRVWQLVCFACFDVYFLANVRIFDLRTGKPMKFADLLFAD